MKTEVSWIPGPWPGRLGIVSRPRGGDWLAADVRSWRQAGIEVVVSLLTGEEASELELNGEGERCREAGVRFHAFPIPDRGVPSSRASLVELVNGLEEALASGRNVAVHCRQGIGRSAVLAAALLVSAGEQSDRAFRSVAGARGLLVPETAEQRRWIEQLASELSASRL